MELIWSWSTAPTIITTVATIIVIFLLWRKVKYNQRYSFPGGPVGLPIVGNLLQLVGSPLHLKLSQWAEEFGSLYTIRAGASTTALIINDAKVMREILGVYPASTGKFNADVFYIPFKGYYGLGCIGGTMWLEQRQFCTKTLRNFGLGKSTTIEPLLFELNDLTAWLDRESGPDGALVLPFEAIQKATFNALWIFVTGERILEGDTHFVDILKNQMDAVQGAIKTGLPFLPFLKYIAPEVSGYNLLAKAGHDINQYITEYFEHHEKNFAEESQPKDLVDAYLERIRNEKDPKSTFFGRDGWKHCIGTVVTLFLAGGETTASTLNWMMFYFCKFPRVQSLLQEEVDRVIGREREPNLQDKTSMPYAEAVILETMRYSSLLPFGIIHELLEDLNFRGYCLPKGTLLWPNLYYAHHNKEVWGDPENFRPERFICGGDEKNPMRENMVGFQVGKRQCLGEGLARDLLFLFTVKLCQKFQFSPDPNVINTDDYMEADAGFALFPKRLHVHVKSRE